MKNSRWNDDDLSEWDMLAGMAIMLLSIAYMRVLELAMVWGWDALHVAAFDAMLRHIEWMEGRGW